MPSTPKQRATTHSLREQLNTQQGTPMSPPPHALASSPSLDDERPPREDACCSSACLRKFWKLFITDEPPGGSPRGAQLEAQYQAPVVTPPLMTRIQEEDEQRRLLTGPVSSSTNLLPANTGTAGVGLSVLNAGDQQQKGHHRRLGSGHDSGRLPSPLPDRTQAKHKKVPSFTTAELASKGGLSYDTTGPGPNSQDEDDSTFCPTCLEPYTPENPKTYTACGHHYHLPCLYEWLERKDTCPVCESPLQFPGM